MRTIKIGLLGLGNIGTGTYKTLEMNREEVGHMLEYLKKRLENREDVSVVYLGGSITEGAGASGTEKRWASLTQTWLEKSYPESTFTFSPFSVNHTLGRVGAPISTI